MTLLHLLQSLNIHQYLHFVPHIEREVARWWARQAGCPSLQLWADTCWIYNRYQIEPTSKTENWMPQCHCQNLYLTKDRQVLTIIATSNSILHIFEIHLPLVAKPVHVSGTWCPRDIGNWATRFVVPASDVNHTSCLPWQQSIPNSLTFNFHKNTETLWL